MTTNFVMVAASACIALFTLRPRFDNSPLWRATVTPLASIIGSGFLVAGPILTHLAGDLAWAAMASLCAVAALFGAAIRHNIAVVEPMLEESPPTSLAVLDRISGFSLAFAYFVSVAYYLNLFASFALRADDIVDPFWTRVLATGVISLLGLLGTYRGLGALENVEIVAVGIKLALIGGLIAALTVADITTLFGGSLRLPGHPSDSGLHELSVLLGLVILVQGFETSRYLGNTYDAELRVRTMRLAQIISTLIYLVFIFLITPYAIGKLPQHGGETAIIDMLRPLGTMVAPLIIFAALGSQLSAAVADMNGASGLLSSSGRTGIGVGLGYFATALVAVLITWTSNIYEIIAFASKAFVLYYGLQSATAVVGSLRAGEPRRWGRIVAFSLAVGVAVVALVFGLPEEPPTG